MEEAGQRSRVWSPVQQVADAVRAVSPAFAEEALPRHVEPQPAAEDGAIIVAHVGGKMSGDPARSGIDDAAALGHRHRRLGRKALRIDHPHREYLGSEIEPVVESQQPLRQAVAERAERLVEIADLGEQPAPIDDARAEEPVIRALDFAPHGSR